MTVSMAFICRQDKLGPAWACTTLTKLEWACKTMSWLARSWRLALNSLARFYLFFWWLHHHRLHEFWAIPDTMQVWHTCDTYSLRLITHIPLSHTTILYITLRHLIISLLHVVDSMFCHHVLQYKDLKLCPNKFEELKLVSNMKLLDVTMRHWPRR